MDTWLGRVLSVTSAPALAIAVIGTVAMAFFLFLVVDGLITGDRSFTLQWANPLFRWSLIALIAGILAPIYRIVLEEIAADQDTPRPGFFKRVGELLVIVPLVVLAAAVIIIAGVSKMLGLTAIIKMRSVWRGESPSWADQLVVRRKINEGATTVKSQDS